MYEYHPITWLASVSCAVGIILLYFESKNEQSAVLSSNTFLPTYSVGILAWTLHGFSINSYAIIIPCAVQLLFLSLMLKKLIAVKIGNFN